MVYSGKGVMWIGVECLLAAGGVAFVSGEERVAMV